MNAPNKFRMWEEMSTLLSLSKLLISAVRSFPSGAETHPARKKKKDGKGLLEKARRPRP